MFQSMGKELKEFYKLYHDIGKLVESVVETEAHILTGVHADAIPTESTSTNVELQLRFNKVKELHSQGYTIRAISRSLHITRITIRKYIGMEFLAKKEGGRSTNFESF